MLNKNYKFGVEIEVCSTISTQALAGMLDQWFNSMGIDQHCVTDGYTHNNNNTCWVCKSDGSVNGIYGNELVTPVLNGFDGLYELYMVCTQFLQPLQTRGIIEIDSSCGLHVHHSLNGGLNETHIQNLYNGLTQNGGIAETILFNVVSNSRLGNTYCKRITNNGHAVPFNQLYTPNGGISDRCRYYSVNIHSFWCRGTVEFRLHHGTVNGEKIINWVQLTNRMLTVLSTGKTVTTVNDLNKNETVTLNFTHIKQAQLIDNSIRNGCTTVTQIVNETGYTRARVNLHLNHLKHKHGFVLGNNITCDEWVNGETVINWYNQRINEIRR